MTERCSTASRARAEPLWATASTVESFLLIEEPGPWGPHILHSRRLPDAVRAAMSAWQRSLGIRTLLIRRPGRAVQGASRVFVANTRHGWVQVTDLEQLDAVADLDLTGIRGRDGVGLTPHDEPVLLVCTHGRHDPCCAERGRPLAAALARDWPDLVWEASHLGGDRFAGNLVALPRGDYFGGLDADSGPGVVAQYLAGQLDPDFHRGRSSQSWVVQAAVHAARRHAAAFGFQDVVVRGVSGQDTERRVGLLVRGRPIDALVRVSAGEAARLTCHADHLDRPPSYEVTLQEPRPGSRVGRA
ncbi:MAG: sucrase ferredoxin [Actinobacteria bacterium]|nr:sucrase ferredoxin [Actinomycetota bacterium]